MKQTPNIDFVEFKRLALIDPWRNDPEQDADFLAKARDCADCQAFLAEVIKLDNQMKASLDVAVPDDLIAKLKLNQELDSNTEPRWSIPRSMAASVAAIFVIAGIIWSGIWAPNKTIDGDYQLLIAAVMEHMHDVPTTPVWSSERVYSSVAASLASYDQSANIRPLQNLQFGKICPMGQYRGLHAVLDTDDGQVTFAYIKGQPVPQLEDHSHDGYMIRVRPVAGGNIVVISRNKSGLEQADSQLNNAFYWDI